MKPFQHGGGFPRKLPLDSPALAPSCPPRTVQSSFVLLAPEERTPFDSDSSDEELAMINNYISLSQDKLQDLSFQDVSNQSDNDNSHALVLALSESFAKMITSDEKRAMKAHGIYVIPLTNAPTPITLGRDKFQSVFGEKIYGADIYFLSRRHCILDVTHRSPSSTGIGKSAVAVVVENTSTNGLWVNNEMLKVREQRRLHLGDVVSLMKIPSKGVRCLLAVRRAILPWFGCNVLIQQHYTGAW